MSPRDRFKSKKGRIGIHTAEGADAAIAAKNLFPQIAGVGAEPPLVDAPVGAEGEAARTAPQDCTTGRDRGHSRLSRGLPDRRDRRAWFAMCSWLKHI